MKYYKELTKKLGRNPTLAEHIHAVKMTQYKGHKIDGIEINILENGNVLANGMELTPNFINRVKFILDS